MIAPSILLSWLRCPVGKICLFIQFGEAPLAVEIRSVNGSLYFADSHRMFWDTCIWMLRYVPNYKSGVCVHVIYSFVPNFLSVCRLKH